MPDNDLQAVLHDVVESLAAAMDRRAGTRQDDGWTRIRDALAAARADHPGVTDPDEQRAGGQPDAADHPEAAAPLVDVVTMFSLDALDAALLGVALAPEVDVNVAAVVSALGDARAAGRPTVGLALELCGVPTTSPVARSRVRARSRLVHHGLVEVVGSGPLLGRLLTIPDRVVGQLLGDPSPDADVLRVLVDVPAVAEPGTAELAAALDSTAPMCWVRGGTGTAGPELAASAFAAAGLEWISADLRRRRPNEDVEQLLRAVLREAALQHTGLVLLGGDDLLRAEHRWLLELLPTAVVPVVVVAAHGFDPQGATTLPYSTQATQLPGPVRAEIWAEALGDLGPEVAMDDGAVTRTVGGLRLGPRAIRTATRHAALLAGLRDEPVGPTDLARAARALGAGSSTSASPVTMDDLVLPADTQQALSRLISWGRHRDTVLAQGELQGRGGKGIGIAALFSGGPGTGKTLAAHVVADALGRDLRQVDLTSVIDKYIGETEKRLERIFTEAEELNTVLFFDEADSLFGSRSAVKDARDRYANLEVSYLLQRMEQFDGITVLATNLRGNLDTAFSRRLHFVISFPDPDADTRTRLWEHHLTALADTDPGDPVHPHALGTAIELSGGDIRNVVLAAAYDAAAENTLVGMRHLTTATEREFQKLGRRLPTTWPPTP